MAPLHRTRKSVLGDGTSPKRLGGMNISVALKNYLLQTVRDDRFGDETAAQAATGDVPGYHG